MAESFAARWVFPTDAPPLGPATITTEAGRVTAITPGHAAGADDWSDSAILPGLVNGHCHLDLTAAAGQTPVTPHRPLPEWLASVVAFRRSLAAVDLTAGIRAGIAELAASGTVLVGDIAATPESARLLASDGRLRAVVFLEVLGLTPVRADAAMTRLTGAIADGEFTDAVRPGVSPHAPYSVGRSLLTRVNELASRRGLPVAMHLGESQDELELLARQTGPFVPFLAKLGVLAGAEFVGTPTEAIDALADAPRRLVVHGNHLTPGDVPPGATVVYCPRTHAAFGHSHHPVLEFLRAGRRVILGTDGRSSNPDLDVFAEACWLFRHRPDIPPAMLLLMLTAWGAEALGFADVARLHVGSPAEFVRLSVDPVEANPYRAIFADPAAPRSVVRF